MSERRGLRRWTLVRAPATAAPASVRRFAERARQRRRHALAPWLAALAGLAVLGLLAVLVYATPLLGVRAVLVRGNQAVGADQVRAAAAVPPGTPLAALDLAAVRDRVGRLPAVRQVRVSRAWPSTVVIAITERTPVAVLAAGPGGYRLIDAGGVVFPDVPLRPAGLPLLAVPAPGPADPSTRAALAVLAALTGQLRAGLVRLVAPAPTRISLELADGRTVVWGDATANDAKDRAATALLGQPGQPGQPGTVLDVSAPSLVTVD
jgi:cell division protein FtsQ